VQEAAGRSNAAERALAVRREGTAWARTMDTGGETKGQAVAKARLPAIEQQCSITSS
jgi:hypothetical protein